MLWILTPRLTLWQVSDAPMGDGKTGAAVAQLARWYLNISTHYAMLTAISSI